MRIFTTRAFNRLEIAKEISDLDLITAVAEMNDGLWDANLGGQVYKKRVALAGRGKRGGSRTLVAFKSRNKAFYIIWLRQESAQQHYSQGKERVETYGL